MIETDIFSCPDKCNLADFRRAMYLSRNNAWVNVAGILYKINITNIIATITREEGDTVYYDKKYYLISENEQDDLKLIISKSLTSLSVCGKGADNYSISASHHEYLTNLDFNIISYEFSPINMRLGEQYLSLQIKIENYDYNLMQIFKNLEKTSLDKVDFINNFVTQKLSAAREAVKNEIWLDAVAGAAKELSNSLNNVALSLQKTIADISMFLLQEVGSNEAFACIEQSRATDYLYETYQGKNIIQAMFEANPANQLPFKNEQANYQLTLSVLLDIGQFNIHNKIMDNSNMTFLELCKKYRSANHNFLGFYKPYNRVQAELLSVLDTRFSAEISPVANCVLL